MSVQIAICDDNPEDIRKLSEVLYTYNDSLKITEYSNGESLVADCLEHESMFDILFLDIYALIKRDRNRHKNTFCDEGCNHYFCLLQ